MLSVRQTTINELAAAFPNAGRHDPDCSSITDEELRSTISASWPIVDGKIRIPFAFSSIPLPLFVRPFSLFYLLPYTEFKQIDYDYEEFLHDLIRVQLNKWTEASQGFITFEEVKNTNLFSKGIFINYGNSNTLIEQSLSGTTDIILDNNGYIKQAFIYYLIDSLSPAQLLYTLAHEIQHALGITKHLHEIESVKDKLKNIADGVYCSVSPYFSEIQNPEQNECRDDCTPYMAVYPTKLDEKMLALALQGERGDFSIYNLIKYTENGFSNFFLISYLTLLQKNIYELANHLEVFKSKTPALFLADAIVTLNLLALELAPEIIMAFVAASVSRYLPESVMQKIPGRINKLIADKTFNLHILSIVMALSDGYKLYPLLVSFVLGAAGIGLFESMTLAEPASIVKNSLRPVTSFFNPVPKKPAVDNPLNEISVASDSENKYRFYQPQKRVSWCQRIGNFMGFKSHSETEEDECASQLLNFGVNV